MSVAPAPDLRVAADSLHCAGLCVLPAVREGDTKRVALSSWKVFQTRLPTDDERRPWFSSERGAICVVCGSVSGNLEVIDFDFGGEAFDPWRRLVDAAQPGLADRLVIQRTPSGGRHAIYRCDAPVGGNTKLAERRIDAPGSEPLVVGAKEFLPRKASDGSWHVTVTLIETRGQGGVILCAPSPGYEMVQGHVASPPTITAAERSTLLQCARELSEVAPPVLDGPKAGRSGELRPGDDFNVRGDVQSLLTKHGWTLVSDGANQHWRRPGKSDGWSATLKDGVLYVFSSNASPFEPNRAYSRFAALALLDHGGDFTAAAKSLRARGYGTASADGPSAPTNSDGERNAEDTKASRLGQRDPLSGRLVLCPNKTLPTAEAFIRQFHSHPEHRTLVGRAGVLYEWRHNRYVAVEDDSIRHRLQPWLHAAQREVLDLRSRQMMLVDFESNPRTVDAALKSIQSFVHLPASTTPSCWLDDREDRVPASEILACRSHSLHVPTRTVLAATPALFTHNALEFDYDPHAPRPVEWFGFLDELFGDDAESIELLREWFGYSLVQDTSQQKILLLVGPPRAGKGSIARVLSRLVGAGNVAGPTISGLAGPFGLQPLVDKSLAVVTDARFTGPHLTTVVERLLAISGEDTLNVSRKFLPDVTLKLPTRFVIISNELPDLADASGALPNRFLVLRLTRSFLGSEDPTLTSRLLEELPGILVWALEGLRTLRARGRFLQPSSASEVVAEMHALASPIAAFVGQHCDVRAGGRAFVDDLFEAWCAWCRQQGKPFADTIQAFGKLLIATVPTVQRRRSSGQRAFYEGLRLKPESPP